MTAQERQAIHALMVRLADGERSAFSALAEALWPVLLSFSRRSLPTPEDAEDVAQDAFVKISTRLSEFDRSRDGVAWAFGIATHEILTHRTRTRRRREHVTTQLEAPSEDRPVDEALDTRRIEAAFQALVGDLSDDDRLALGLAGESSGPAPAAARKRKQRALGRLKALWRSIHGDV